jgi:hypothetical protein
MAEKKQADLFGKAKLTLQAKPGCSLPVRYKGQWVRVTKDAPVELDVSSLPYEAKIEIKAAVDAGEVVEVAPAAPTPAAKGSDKPKEG